ncbi:MAG: hypothetical protein GWP59_00985 [Chlamydiales bacterium]|nr:hypothetical protein [Chlamydiales bacterium]
MTDPFSSSVALWSRGNTACSIAVKSINLLNPPHSVSRLGERLFSMAVSIGDYNLTSSLRAYTWINISCYLAEAVGKSALSALTYYILKEYKRSQGKDFGSSTALNITSADLSDHGVSSLEHDEFVSFMNKHKDDEPFNYSLTYTLEKDKESGVKLYHITAQNMLKLFVFHLDRLSSQSSMLLSNLVVYQPEEQVGDSVRRQSSPERRSRVSLERPLRKGGTISFLTFIKCMRLYFHKLTQTEFRDKNLLYFLAKGFEYTPSETKLKIVQNVALAALSFSGSFFAKRSMPLLACYFAVKIIPIEFVKEGITASSLKKVWSSWEVSMRDKKTVVSVFTNLFDAAVSFILYEQNTLSKDWLLPIHAVSAGLRAHYSGDIFDLADEQEATSV